MAPRFDQIEPHLNELRAFILNDLRQIVEQPDGGNYSATAVIACACEAVGRLRYGTANGARFFTSMLPADWRSVGPRLYDAVRNGLVHGYRTKTLVIEGHRIEVGLSRRKHPHLSLSPDRRTLFLNIAAMTDDLGHAFDLFREELRVQPELRDRYLQMHRREATADVSDSRERAAWQRLLGR